MSIRTIIEINHDHLYRLENIDTWKYFIDALKSANPDKYEFEASTGHRILGQRHHAETLHLKIE